MYNLRYHIASLVAVFLSLAIGLLLGTIVVERGTLDRQRDAIVKALQEEFRTLADDNEALRADNEQLAAYTRDTLGVVLAGQLAGETVAVIADPSQADAAALVADSVRAAGGSPVAVSLKMAGFGLQEPEVSQVATSVVGTATPDALASSVVASLAAEWTVPSSSRPLTDALTSAGVFEIADFQPESALTGVVVLAAWDGAPDLDALALAARITDAGGVGVGAETQTSPTGVAGAAAERGLSAVDHADEVEGRFSLVYVLSGKAAGYFGIGEAASARYPAISPE